MTLATEQTDAGTEGTGIRQAVTDCIKNQDIQIAGGGRKITDRKRKAGGECMDTVKKLCEFFNCTAELFISCLALLFILPLLYLLAALTGQLFTEIWEIREYKYKTDKKNSTESGKKNSLTVNCQPSAANRALGGKVK